MPTVITQGAASAKGYGFGARATAANYIEDVFSTYLYTGTAATQTITNGIDLSTNSGMVWLKSRSAVGDHYLFDTSRGTTKFLASNSTNPQLTGSTTLTAFNSNGFTLGSATATNGSGTTYTSWSFRKQAKFFDVVTFTAAASTSINHNLGSSPGCVIVKSTTKVENWWVFHRSTDLANGAYGILNSTAAFATSGTSNAIVFSSTSVNFNEFFSVSSGQTYVAYLFAHDAGGFGATGTDNVISCGSYVGNGSTTGPVITLGYEPQWFLVKAATNTTNWFIGDTTRWWSLNTTQYSLSPNSSGAETLLAMGFPTATGFQLNTAGSNMNANGVTYIYIAIRRGPMKTPTTGTSVFSPNAVTAAIGTAVTTNFPVDLQISMDRGSSGSRGFMDRLRGASSTTTSSAQYLESNGTAAEINAPTARYWNNTGFQVADDQGSLSYVYENFRRAPGFFDVVCYTGTGAALTLNHNLGAIPEFWIIKSRSVANSWYCGGSVLGSATGNYIVINSTNAKQSLANAWLSPTTTTFGPGSGIPGEFSASGVTYASYLFASCPGVSKVGSYTGTGTTNQINCGFTGGARFVLIKRTDSTGDWYVWDTARGIVAGNDPYLLLNSTAAEVTGTDYVDTYSAGFEISSTAPAAINANGGTFIFLAIA